VSDDDPLRAAIEGRDHAVPTIVADAPRAKRAAPQRRARDDTLDTLRPPMPT
jgi:hypothetical protein